MNAVQNEAMPGSVLLVEDNVRLAEEMCLILASAGLHTRHATDGELMRPMLADELPQVVLLDLNLPGEDGISLCKWLRRTYPSIGIVILTARVMGSERTEGYAAGGDVYLTKPTRPVEILAVIRNLMRRTQRDETPTTGSLRAWTLNLAGLHLITPNSDVLSLTPKEAQVLKVLAQTPGDTGYPSLLHAMGGEASTASADKARLEVLVSRLRSKLQSVKMQGFEIKTVHGRGFKLSNPLHVTLR
jgi:two-component system OmpR family response regulator